MMDFYFITTIPGRVLSPVRGATSKVTKPREILHGVELALGWKETYLYIKYTRHTNTAYATPSPVSKAEDS